jgi:hypothetical protein
MAAAMSMVWLWRVEGKREEARELGYGCNQTKCGVSTVIEEVTE